MRPAMILRLLAPLALLVLAALPARAQTCTITPPASFNLGSIDVLANSVVDVQTTVSISCTVTAGQQVRLCLSMGRPNGETGTRYLVNGANRLSYELYSDPGRTQVFGSWKNGTGNGLELVFTPATATYNTTATLYARVFAAQQSVPTQNPALTYSEAFTRTTANLYQRSRYTSTGQTCPVMTTGGGTWGVAMTVSASVLFKCNIGSGALNFGSTNSLASTIDASTNVSLACSNTLPYTISLDNGLYGTSATTRKMASGTNRIAYSLYRDAGRTLNWGSTMGTDTLSGTGSGATISVPIYGRVPAQTTPPPGGYTDTVNITVTY